MYILGAGMAGCLAGVMFPEAIVVERQAQLPHNHDAVLRFRTDAISKVTGIPFKKVQVHKGIWYEDGFVDMGPKYINEYARKVTGGSIVSRSIDTVTNAPQTRYIAPPDFQNLLATMLGERLVLNKAVKGITPHQIHLAEVGDIFSRGKDGLVISTLPMPIMNRIGRPTIEEKFEHSSIWVMTFDVAGCEVCQTIYYPDPGLKIYRASLTRNRLIVESTGTPGAKDMDTVHSSLGLAGLEPVLINEDSQPFGKIVSVDEHKRKNFILQLTQELNVYSLGRFACWREGTMMDDVYKDIFQIRQMMNRHPYDGAIGKEVSSV